MTGRLENMLKISGTLSAADRLPKPLDILPAKYYRDKYSFKQSE